MKNTLLISTIAFLIVIVGYIFVGVWIVKDTRQIVENGMRNGSNYVGYMTENTYAKLNPAKRGITNYESVYNPENHLYQHIRPWHLFFIARVSLHNYYRSGITGFNENVVLKLKLQDGRWVATDARIKP
ncbi:hypothetical protein [Cohnella zeiphila]|uniref:Uncharacterized protein n=1 Tax=Cohnella zeiphila TaxID=2761120 RepID=A0A7X0SQE6_9BACL|nr:hypothetical protein [Cohnella zeiphila]MBB6734066.1 hypothetical protein [Cohnella zeiphila]